MALWFRPPTLVTFVVVTIVAFAVSYLVVMNQSGTVRLGLPFSFLQSSSAPPPANTSHFTPAALLADLVVYYLIAVALVWAWGRLSPP